MNPRPPKPIPGAARPSQGVPVQTGPAQPPPQAYQPIAPPAPISRPSTRGGGSTNISVTPQNFDQFRDFGDIVMQEFQRTTAPEIEARRARMNQDLVNRGLTPGSEGYEREMDRFMRMENDMFSTAQRSALQEGLAAQNQAWNQGFGQAQINAGLRQAQIGADANMYNADVSRAGSLERLLAQLGQQESEFGRNFGEGQRQFNMGFGENQRQFDSNMGFNYAGLDQNQNQFLGRLGFDFAGLGENARQFDNNLGFNYAGLGENARQFNQNLGQRESEFGRNFGLASDQTDMGFLMQLLGYGMDSTSLNNQFMNDDFNRTFNTVGSFQPNAPFVPINVGGAYNTQLNAQNARQQIRAGNHNSLMSGIGQLGAAAMPFIPFSDRNAKTDFKPVDNAETLEAIRKMPVSRWKYKGEDREHIGPMAQDFGGLLNDEPEATVIHGVDAIGALIASVQALADRVDELEGANAAV